MNSVDLMNIPLKISLFQNIVGNFTYFVIKIVGPIPQARDYVLNF
jgi:hypothetical protein